MSERPLSIDEKCGCGAEFHYRTTTGYPKTAAETVASWRSNHRHIEPAQVGICGEAPANYPEIAGFLVRHGISSISVNPSSLLTTLKAVHDAEEELFQADDTAPALLL